MTQTTAAQRAELADLLTSIEHGGYWAEQSILELVPALLADAAALAAREEDDAARKERTRAALTRLAKLSEKLGLYDQEEDDAAGDPPIVTPAVPSREVTVRIVGRERVVSARYAEVPTDGR